LWSRVVRGAPRHAGLRGGRRRHRAGDARRGAAPGTGSPACVRRPAGAAVRRPITGWRVGKELLSALTAFRDPAGFGAVACCAAAGSGGRAEPGRPALLRTDGSRGGEWRRGAALRRRPVARAARLVAYAG